MPSWITAVKPAPGSGQPSSAGTMRRWPLEEIGRNSVSPWTRPENDGFEVATSRRILRAPVALGRFPGVSSPSRQPRCSRTRRSPGLVPARRARGPRRQRRRPGRADHGQDGHLLLLRRDRLLRHPADRPVADPGAPREAQGTAPERPAAPRLTVVSKLIAPAVRVLGCYRPGVLHASDRGRR